MTVHDFRNLSKLVTVSSVMAGVAIGFGGWMARRLAMRDRHHVAERLDAIEHRFAMDKALSRYGQHIALQERLDRIEERIQDIARASRRHRRRT